MGKFKRNWLKATNAVWALILGVLGFTACSDGLGEDDPGEIRLEYGTPTVHYKIKGKVVDQKKNPVADIQVIVKEMFGDNTGHSYSWDTLTTDKQGEFLFDKIECAEDRFRIDFQDVKNGKFDHDSIPVVEMPSPTGGEGWYRGESYKEVTKILKEKTINTDGE